jgi:hypothetical protein
MNEQTPVEALKELRSIEFQKLKQRQSLEAFNTNIARIDGIDKAINTVTQLNSGSTSISDK